MTPSRYKPVLDLIRERTPGLTLYIKLLFVELIKLVYDELRIYKDIPQGKLVVNFRNFT